MKYIYAVHTGEGLFYFSSKARALDYCIRQGYHVDKYKTDYTHELHDIHGDVATIYKEILNIN